MTQPISLPYGLRDVRVTPYTTAAATVLASTSIDLPNARTFSFTEAEDFTDLRGDDQLQASHGSGPNVEWELEGGGVSFEFVQALYGGTLAETGITPNRVKTLYKQVTDVRPYFLTEGQSISDSGGDFHIKVYRCKATDNLEGQLGDGEFFLTGASGKGYASKVGADLNKVWAFVQNETATAIP